MFILDDDGDILFILKYWLSHAGYDVHVFTRSADMLQPLNEYSPDMMLLDINLPGEDGREVCRMMRIKLHYYKPILHISANHFLYDATAGSCANGFIAKPFDLKEVTKTVDSFITK